MAGRWKGRKSGAAVAALFVILLSSRPFADIPEDAAFYNGWTVTEVRFEGASKDAARELRRGLALAPRGGFLRTRRALFYSKVLRDDVERARLYFARRGYPEVEVGARIDPERTSRALAVILSVRSGPAARVETYRALGMPPTAEGAIAARRDAWLGSLFDDERFGDEADLLTSILLDSGYAWAKVEGTANRDPRGAVDVVFHATPGPRCAMGTVVVEGAPGDLEPLVRRTMSVRAGRRYSPSIADEARRNLRLLDLFRQIRVEPVDAGDGVVDLRAVLVPRKPRSVEFGVGYWTDDGPRGYGQWEHRDFFHRGRGLRLQGAGSRYRQSVGASLWWPAWLGARTRGELNMDAEWEQEASYDVASQSVEIGARFRPSFTTTVRAGVSMSHVRVTVKTDEPDAFVAEGGLLTTLSLLGHRDSSDDRLYPTGGAITWARSEWAPPGFLTESHYLLGEASATKYLGFTERIVLATRVSGGAAGPTSPSVDLLPNKRFFAGGASSMRGFQRRQLGPRDQAGAPLGGEAKIEASVELRFPLFWRFRGAAFADAGQVWSQAKETRLDRMEVAVGPGLMIMTPVGAVRGDYGHRLTTRETNEPRNVFHLSIGNPF